MESEIRAAVGAGSAEFFDATRLATALCGDAVATNMLLLGYAWQRGVVPLAAESILRAVELNGAAVAMNRAAFAWGRRAASDLARVEQAAGIARRLRVSLDDLVATRARELTDYQDAGYARRYTALVEAVRQAEGAFGGSDRPLTEAVARAYYRLLACKDEYEVARLYTDGRFRKALEDAFEGDYAVRLHLAPLGARRKRAFGGWTLGVLRVLARMKRVRGSALDPFAHTAERRLERALIAEYESTIRALLPALTPDNHAGAVEIAALPERIRGFGAVKRATADAARAERERLLGRLHVDAPALRCAA
jgi:indolepyruvate ferredoxin oxidoreductase